MYVSSRQTVRRTRRRYDLPIFLSPSSFTLAPRPSHFTTYRREKGSTAAAAAMFHARLSIFVFLAVAATAAVAQSDSCPFYPGICPVTLDNTIGVSRGWQEAGAPKRNRFDACIFSATTTTSTTFTRVSSTARPSRPATTSPCLTTLRGTRRNASTSPNAARTVPNAQPVQRRGEIPDAAARSAKNFYGRGGGYIRFFCRSHDSRRRRLPAQEEDLSTA